MPAAVRAEMRKWIRQATAREVERVTTDARATIRKAVEGRLFGTLPKREAAELVRRVIGLNGNQVHAIAKLTADLAARGVSAPDIARQSDRLAQQLLRTRAQTIATYETAKARSAAQRLIWADWQQRGKLAASARKLWVANNDACAQCQELDGEEVGLGDLFDSAHDAPPLHVACKCRLVLVRTERQHAVGPPAETLAALEAQQAISELSARLDELTRAVERIATRPHPEQPDKTVRFTRDAMGRLVGAEIENVN